MQNWPLTFITLIITSHWNHHSPYITTFLPVGGSLDELVQREDADVSIGGTILLSSEGGGGIISGSIFLNLFLLENYVVWPGQPQCKEGRWCKADSSRGRSLSRTPKPHRRQRRARQTPVISLPTCTICGLKIPNSSTAEKCFSSNGGEKKNILEG